MISVIIVIHLMLVVALIGVVMLQKSEGGGLVSSTSGFLTGRGTANVLTRTTALLAAGFFLDQSGVVVARRVRPQADLNHQYWRRRDPGGAAERADRTAQLRRRRSQPVEGRYPRRTARTGPAMGRFRHQADRRSRN